MQHEGDRNMMERRMKDSGIPWIGMIPEEWEVLQIKRTVNLVSEKNDNDNLPYIGLENIEPQTGKFLTSSIAYEPENNSNKYTKGDVLFGKLRPYLAKCIIGESDGRCSSELLVLRSIILNNKFLHKFLLSPNFIDVINSSTYGTKMPRANWDFISSCQIPVPAIGEQEAIAEWLDGKCGEIDELIDVEQRMIEELEAYRQATITEAVTRGPNPNAPMRQTSIPWLPEIPKHWSKDKILRLFGLFGSGTTPKGEEWFTDVCGIPWINSGELNSGFLENTKKSVKKQAIKEISALKIYPKNSIIIAMYGASIGKIAISKIEGCTNQACFVMSNERNDVDLKYIFYQLLSFKDKWIELSFGGTQPNINADNIKQKWVALPPIAEQREIADYLDAKCKEIDELIAVKREKIEMLKQYRQSIIFEAVTGKIQIN